MGERADLATDASAASGRHEWSALAYIDQIGASERAAAPVCVEYSRKGHVFVPRPRRGEVRLRRLSLHTGGVGVTPLTPASGVQWGIMM